MASVYLGGWGKDGGASPVQLPGLKVVLRGIGWVLTVGIGLLPLSVQAQCPANLKTAIEAVTSKPEFQAGRWGILVQTLASASQDGLGQGQTLYQQDAEKFFLVASNVKLLTTAAALQQFGPNHQFVTQVLGQGQGSNWDWVRLVGAGDPSLSNAELNKIAQALWQQGMRRINVLEIASPPFANAALNPSWALEDLHGGEIAPITRLTLNRNALVMIATPQGLGRPLKLAWEQPQRESNWQIQNETQTVTLDEPEYLETELDESRQYVRITGQLHQGSEPATHYISLLNPFPQIQAQWRYALEGVGIQVEHVKLQTNPHAPIGTPLFTLPSPPIADLIRQTNQDSDNFYAEMLQHLLDDQQPDQRNRILGDWGLVPHSYRLVDGSGLSRQNWVTPTALVQLLQAQRHTPTWPLFQDSLPQAGINGTLEQRFVNTPAMGRVWAKTGTLRGVAALSGYAYPPDYEPLVFSIVVNQANMEAATLRSAIDQIVLHLIGLRSCPDLPSGLGAK